MLTRPSQSGFDYDRIMRWFPAFIVLSAVLCSDGLIEQINKMLFDMHEEGTLSDALDKFVYRFERLCTTALSEQEKVLDLTIAIAKSEAILLEAQQSLLEHNDAATQTWESSACLSGPEREEIKRGLDEQGQAIINVLEGSQEELVYYQHDLRLAKADAQFYAQAKSRMQPIVMEHLLKCYEEKASSGLGYVISQFGYKPGDKQNCVIEEIDIEWEREMWNKFKSMRIYTSMNVVSSCAPLIRWTMEEMSERHDVFIVQFNPGDPLNHAADFTLEPCYALTDDTFVPRLTICHEILNPEPKKHTLAQIRQIRRLVSPQFLQAMRFECHTMIVSLGIENQFLREAFIQIYTYYGMLYQGNSLKRIIILE